MSAIRVNSSGVAMDLDTFRKVEYADVCAHLGLRPSKPWHTADGNYVGPKRRRRKGRKNGAHRKGATTGDAGA